MKKFKSIIQQHIKTIAKILSIFVFGVMLHHLFDFDTWITDFQKGYVKNENINVMVGLTILYAFSTKEEDPLDNYILLFIAKKFIRISLGTFFTVVFFVRLCHIGILIDTVSLKLTNFLILNLLLFTFFKVETMLCNTILFFKDCITNIFSDKVEVFLILSFDTVILLILMCIILNCFFKKPLNKLYSILKSYFDDKS